MTLKQVNLLYFTRTMKLGGTENVVLQLCEIMQPLVNKVVVCSCGGVNVEKLNKMGIKHYEIPDIETKSIKSIITASKRLLSIIKDEDITVIHTHHRMAAFYVALLGLYKKTYFICTAHNTFTNKRLLTRFAYKHANIVACGEMVKKNLRTFFKLKGEQITVIHNAVKTFKGPVIEDELICNLHKEGYYIVGNIGRLSEQKGLEYYIRAIPAVIERHPKTYFLIIGDGEDKGKLKELVSSLGLEDSVSFLGYRTDIQNLMSQIDLVVLSSLWEGLPLTPIEAFSVGKTIVATDVDGTAEVVKNGRNGILISPRRSDQISEKIIWAIEHPKITSENSNSSFLNISQFFL